MRYRPGGAAIPSPSIEEMEAEAAVAVLRRSEVVAARLTEAFIAQPLQYGELRVASDALLGSVRPLVRVEVGHLSEGQARQLLELLTMVLNGRWPEAPSRAQLPAIDPLAAIVFQHAAQRYARRARAR